MTPGRVLWFLVAPLATVAVTATVAALDASLFAYRLYRSRRPTCQ